MHQCSAPLLMIANCNYRRGMREWADEDEDEDENEDVFFSKDNADRIWDQMKRYRNDCNSHHI